MEMFLFILGVAIGRIWKDHRLEKTLKSQQERGDHWFSKYQAIVKYGQDYPENYDFYENSN